MQLVLIGYRGTGKTSVARSAALRLGWEWVDLDVEIELAAGKSIAAIFDEGGESAFRELEAAALARLAGRDQFVLAAGGGIVLHAQNRDQLSRLGKVVWLRARPETILARVSADPTTAARRPNLTTAGGLDEIVQLLQRRTPLYQQCAQLAVDTDDISPDEVADDILQRLNLVPPAASGA